MTVMEERSTHPHIMDGNPKYLNKLHNFKKKSQMRTVGRGDISVSAKKNGFVGLNLSTNSEDFLFLRSSQVIRTRWACIQHSTSTMIEGETDCSISFEK